MSGGVFSSNVPAPGSSYADDKRMRVYANSFSGSPDTDVDPEPDVIRTSVEYLKMDMEAATPVINPNTVIPFVIGRQRIVSPQVIWHGNQRVAYEKTEKVETKIETQNEPSEYYDREVERVVQVRTVTYKPVDILMTVVLGLCLGPRVRLKAIYSDNEKIWEGNTTDGRNIIQIPGKKPFERCIFYSGQLDAQPDPFLAPLVGAANAPGFVGLSYVIIPTIASKDYQSSSLSFEVERTEFNTRIADDLPPAADEHGDVNAAEMIFQALRSKWGALSIKPKFIDTDSFRAYFELCAERGWYFSATYGEETFGSNVLDDMLSFTKSILYVDLETEKLKIKSLIASEFDEVNAITLNTDHVTEVQEIDRTDWTQLPTHFRIEYSARKQHYKRVPLTRKSLSIDLDDVQSEWRQLRINGAIITRERTAKLILTQFIMENGWPRLSITFRATTEGDKLRIGDGFYLNLPAYGIRNEPFWVMNVKHTASDINEVVVTARRIGRQDDIDVLDEIDSEPEDFSDYVPVDPTPVTPQHYKAYSQELPVNYVRRQGVTTVYKDYKVHATYAVLLVRAENDFQVGFDVLDENGDAVMLNVAYAASGFLVNGITKDKGRVDGFLGDVELSDPTGFGSIDPTVMTLAHCGEHEWFAFTGFTFKDNGNIVLHKVMRSIWATVPEDIPPGSLFWCVNDMPRLLPPVTNSGIRNFRVVPYTAHRAADPVTESMPVYVEYFPNMTVARPPSRVYLNGKRVFHESEPITLYFGEEYTLSWVNQTRLSTDINGIFFEDSSYEFRDTSTFRDRYWVDIIDEEENYHVWLGVSFVPYEPATEFEWTHVTFTVTNEDFYADGTWKIYIMHFLETASWPFTIYIEFAENPGVIADFDFEFRRGFFVDFAFDYEIKNW